jgi:membrane-bound metal-dependent hydrolase YbcI (DUF457 family)
MASPIGHALVGVSVAAVAMPVAGVSPSAALWIGSVIASGLPDLDLAGIAFGLSVKRAHRAGTHSLIVLGIVALLALGISWPLKEILPPNLVAVWSVVLLTHPLLDLLATGPQAAYKGMGLPLFWPLWPRRWHMQNPLLQPPSLEQYKSSAVWRRLLPELKWLGPICVVMVLLGEIL